MEKFIMLILNNQKCEKCGEKALGLIEKIWLCGNCINKISNKIDENRRKFILG